MNQEIIQQDLNESSLALNCFMSDEKKIEAIEQAVMVMTKALERRNKIISCGNGGSMCDAMHFAEELTGRYRGNRMPLPAIALNDPAHITCTANDFGFEFIFSRSVESLGNRGDVLLAFTSSGNSENILEAAKIAKEKGMKVVGMTGKDGGKLASFCDVEIRAPFSDYADRVQEIHTKVVHILLHCIEKEIGLNNQTILR